MLLRRLYSTSKLDGIVRRFNDVHIKKESLFALKTDTQFDNALKETLDKYKLEKRSSIWLYVPLELSNLIKISSKYGFKYHHAENDEAVLFKWLIDDRQCTIPRFATHQLGVAGFVYDTKSKQVLCIKDKHSQKDFWKLPGGSADLGESIHETSVREVKEETGIDSKFESVIGFRQVHEYPGAFGRSDIYVVCRLKPLNFEIKKDSNEIQTCEWLCIDYLANKYKNNPLLTHLSRLVLNCHNQDNNNNNNNNDDFTKIDIKRNELKFASNSKTYYFYSI